MGTNDSPLIYLAQPIDMIATLLGGGDDLSTDTWSMAGTAISRNVLGRGWTFYYPQDAFGNLSKASPEVLAATGIDRINRFALEQAGALIAMLPRNAVTYGVLAEIGTAVRAGKPTLIVTDETRSVVVSGWRSHDHVITSGPDKASIDRAVDWLALTMSQPKRLPVVSEVVFEKRHIDAILPTKGYPTDAGYDLYAVEEVTVPARGQAEVSCGVAVDVPDGMWAQITGRSSTLKKRNLMVAPTVGVIDSGYTGELFAPIVSISDEDEVIHKGDRLAQLILHEAPGTRFTPAWGAIPSKDRGENGFGSTGR